jgi:DNA polymerase-3 subunit beta
MSLIIDTELIRYKWVSADGEFPDYEKLTPTEFNYSAHFDTVEAIKAINSLKVLSDSKAYPIDLTIGNGKMVMANPDEKGQAELSADTEGEGKVRVDGSYLLSVLRACGGMVDLQVTSPISPMLFSQNGYYVVVMPMMTEEASKVTGEKPRAKPKTAKTAKGKGEKQPEPEPTEPEPKPKPEPAPAK